MIDQLVSPGVLALIGPAARRIHAGKQRNHHTLQQHEINELLVSLARQGEVVVPQGGDPSSSAAAAGGSAGAGRRGHRLRGGAGRHRGLRRIGLCRHPAHAPRLCAELHLRHRPPEGRRRRARLGRPRPAAPDGGDLHGPDGAGADLREAIAHGLPPPTQPAAVVQQGTTAAQRVVTGTLADLAQRVAAAGLSSPALTIVGEVVRPARSARLVRRPAAGRASLSVAFA